MKKRSYRAQKVNEIGWDEVAGRVKGKRWSCVPLMWPRSSSMGS